MYASYNGTYYYWNQINWNNGYSGWTADLGLGLAFGYDSSANAVRSFNGVVAYSNGSTDYVSSYNNYGTGINTGMEWQCVEYVNRLLI